MRKQVEIRKAKQEDILPIAHRMRKDDVKEVYDSHRVTPYKALLMGVKAEGNCWTILGDGIPEGMMGVTRRSLLSDRGIVWMLGTDVLVQDKRLFISISKDLFVDVVKGFDYIENHVSVENKISLRWLESMGFEIEEKTIMINGVGFRKFHMELS